MHLPPSAVHQFYDRSSVVEWLGPCLSYSQARVPFLQTLAWLCGVAGQLPLQSITRFAGNTCRPYPDEPVETSLVVQQPLFLQVPTSQQLWPVEYLVPWDGFGPYSGAANAAGARVTAAIMVAVRLAIFVFILVVCCGLEHLALRSH